MTMLKLGTPESFTPHWVSGLSNEDYHADRNFISSTPLKNVVQESPLYFFDSFYNAPKIPPTSPMLLSSLIHHAVLEGEDFINRYVVMPKFPGHGNSKEYKQAKAEWLAANKLKIIVTQEEVETLQGTYEAIFNHSDAKSLLMGAKFEESGYYYDTKTGIPLRVRYDAYDYQTSCLVDLKAVRSCKKVPFSFAVRDYRWDISMAMYGQGIKAIDGKEPDDYVFIAVEKTRPYQVAVYQIGRRTLKAGLSDYRKALDTIAHCAKTGVWPSYQSNMEELELPNHFLERYENVIY